MSGSNMTQFAPPMTFFSFSWKVSCTFASPRLDHGSDCVAHADSTVYQPGWLSTLRVQNQLLELARPIHDHRTVGTIPNGPKPPNRGGHNANPLNDIPLFQTT